MSLSLRTGDFLRALAALGFGKDNADVLVDSKHIAGLVANHYPLLQEAWYADQLAPRVSPFIELRLNGSVVTVNAAQIEAIHLNAQAERITVGMVGGASYSALRDDGASVYATYERLTNLIKEATK